MSSAADQLQCLPHYKIEKCRSKLLPSASNPSNDFSEDPQPCGYWSSVSPSYHGYRLGSLLRQPCEIGQFMSFLQKQDASIHLMCWLDLEQYRRTSQMDEDIKQGRSSHIAAKYLNKKYFFGSDSPATAEEQNHILRCAGGLEHLKSLCLSEPVAMEIQDIIRNHMEETWLPLFLSSKEFAEGQKHKKKLQTADRLSQHVYSRRRARTKAWKVQGLWMNSSIEVMLFRRVLLNPTSRQQFQHFVSLKGDFLENDVRFWVEVQKYKDLCHSHCDEATIHQKISTIISCFINSSMPPTLQIDIPADQAQRILEKRHQLGPYIFREAQVSVFSELLRFWPEFQEFSSTVQDEQLLPLLQKKRLKQKKQRMEAEEERG